MESCFRCLRNYDHSRHLWSSPGFFSLTLLLFLSDFPLDSPLLLEID